MSDRHPETLPGWLLVVGLWLAVAGVALQTAGNLVFEFWDPALDFLSADREASIAAWAGSAATFGAAFAVFLLFGLQRRTAWLVLALALAYFSIDDVAAFHERFALRVQNHCDLSDTAYRGLWVAFYLPLLAVATLLLVRLAREAGARERRFIYAGLGLLAFAVVAEATTALFDGVTFDAWEVTFEEGAELAGWILIAAALTAHTIAALNTASIKEKRVN